MHPFHDMVCGCARAEPVGLTLFCHLGWGREGGVDSNQADAEIQVTKRFSELASRQHRNRSATPKPQWWKM
jgi:hypothetical protein